MENSINIGFLFRSYRRYFEKKLKNVSVELAKKGSPVTFNLRFENDGNNKGSITFQNAAPDNEAVVHFLSVLGYRFLNHEDNLFYLNIWNTLKANFSDALGAEVVTDVDNTIETMNKASNLTWNGKPLSSEEVARVYGMGVFFNQPGPERDTFEALTAGPYSVVTEFFVKQLFFDYNLKAFKLAATLFELIEKIKSSGKFTDLFIDPRAVDTNLCLFCKRTDTLFTSEEHIIPEGLGNYDIVLPKGYVCDNCNKNVFSPLDKELQDFPSIAYIAMWCVPYTKKGKFPLAKVDGRQVKKITPGFIQFWEPSPDPKKWAFYNFRELENGLTEWSSKFSTNRKIKWKKLCQALYKIALEEVAYVHGREKACDQKYDAAREFVLTGKDFKNNIIICKQVDVTFQTGIVHIEGEEGTIFLIKILGHIFILNLEEKKILTCNEELATNLNFSKEEIFNNFLVVSISTGKIEFGDS